MSTGKILVVDDEPQIRRVMRSALTKQGYIVADARSGEEALEKLRDERYDLIILDRNMPGMGGLEACRSIRATSDVGIIMLTVRKAEPDKIEALDAGADDYVTKPFSMPELLARVRANLRRLPLSPQEGPIIVAFDGKKESVFALKQFSNLFPEYDELPIEFVYIKDEETDDVPDMDLLKEYTNAHYDASNITKLHFHPGKSFNAWLKNKKNTLLISGSFSRSGASMLLRRSFVEKIIKNNTGPVFIAHNS